MACPRIVALVAACSLVACVEDVDNVGAWAKPNGTFAGFQTDTDECQRAAILVPIPYAGPASVPAERRRCYNDCMAARGWTFDPQASSESGKTIVDCKLRSVEQVQRLSARDCHNRYGKILESP